MAPVTDIMLPSGAFFLYLADPDTKIITPTASMAVGIMYPAKNPQSGPPKKGKPYWHMYAINVYYTNAPKLMDQ